MEKAKVCFTKKLLPDDVRRMYRILEKGLPGRAAEEMGVRALMVVPYGEALVHPWYWEGLAQLSACAKMDAVGIQTNLSFGVREFADCFARTGGAFAKLRLWATFHPEMTSVSDFAAKCRQLQEQGIQLCAGSVGVPQNLSLLRQLKQQLDVPE